MKDHDAIQAYKKERQVKSVAIIGAGFIGIEAAAAIKMTDPSIEVNVIDAGLLPVERVFGKDIGQTISETLSEGGVKLHMNNKVEGVTGNGDYVEGVEVSGPSGEKKTIPADLVLMAVGSKMDTIDFVKEAGLK